MKRNLSMVLGVVLILVLVLSIISCGQSATPSPTAAPATTSAAPIITLKFAAYHAASTAEAQFCQAFIDEVQTKTNGRVKIDFFPGGSLLTVANMYDGVQNGIADFGESSLDNTADKFLQTQLGLLPIGAPSPWVITRALNDFYGIYTPKEFSATHMMWLWGNGPGVLMTTKPVKTLEDLKGLKIRAQGMNSLIIKALGGTPQTVPMADMYDGLSKGVVDGVLVDPSVLVSFKLGDVTKYITNTSKAIGSSTIFYVVMNQGTWNKLPADIQTIITQVNTEFYDKAGLAVNQEDIDGLNYAKSKGDTFIDLTDTESARWTAAISSVSSDYVNRLNSSGFSAQADVLKYIQDRITYWSAQQTVQKIPLPFP